MPELHSRGGSRPASRVDSRPTTSYCSPPSRARTPGATASRFEEAAASTPLGGTLGYRRSMGLMLYDEQGRPRKLESSSTEMHPPPRLEADLVQPRTFPLPPRRATTGCSNPLTLSSSVGQTLGCAATTGGALGFDPSLSSSAASRAAVLSPARQRWQLCRQVFLIGIERKVELLQGIGILDGCSRFDLVRLAHTLELSLVGRMRRLVRQYEHPTFFAIVLRGTLEARDVNAGTLKLGEGECVGIEALGAHYGKRVPSLRTIISATPVLLLVHILPPELRHHESGGSGGGGGSGSGSGATPLEGSGRERLSRRLVDTAWLDALLMRQRTLIETHLIAALVLRMRQFSHLRFLLPLRLRLAALLSLELVPANTAVVAEGTAAEEVSTYFLLHGELSIFITDKLKTHDRQSKAAGHAGQMMVGQISFRDLKAHVGDLATFSDEAASATVVSHSQCVCLVLRREQAAAFAELLPEFAQNASLMALELRRMRSAAWSGFHDALEVKTIVEASKLKVNRLLGVQRLELMQRHQRQRASTDPPIALPPLLRIKEHAIDENFTPPADCAGLPPEHVKSLRRRSTIRRDKTVSDITRADNAAARVV